MIASSAVAGKRSTWEWAGLVVMGAGAVITGIASFFLAGEQHYPGLFYIQRQALWDNGSYGVNFTFLLTWFTLLDLIAIPSMLVAGTVALVNRLGAPVTPAPPGWDLQQTGRRLKQGAVALVLLPLWVAVTGSVVWAPDWFSPLGGFASILLLLLPLLPLLGPALLFEAVIPPSYVEGVIEGMRVTRQRNRTTVHLFVAGRSYGTQPQATQGLAQGMRVGLLATGFFKNVRRLVRLS